MPENTRFPLGGDNSSSDIERAALMREAWLRPCREARAYFSMVSPAVGASGVSGEEPPSSKAEAPGNAVERRGLLTLLGPSAALPFPLLVPFGGILGVAIEVVVDFLGEMVGPAIQEA